MIRAGFHNSIFQNKDGEIYAAGSNNIGELGLGHTNTPDTPSLIPNLLHIIQFSCGQYHTIFLDVDGNVFFVGKKNTGFPGIEENQIDIQQIKDIPPVQIVSCVNKSSYLLDFDGFVWAFGSNNVGQLGLDEKTDVTIPTKIPILKDICGISDGISSNHFLARDGENKIYVMGDNYYGQLTETNDTNVIIPQEMKSTYPAIWGCTQSRAKSARK